MSNQASKPSGNLPDALRRKLVKGGLAAPVVLATLASKPVLGAAPWKCTISGQVSGNMSGHESETCSQLGDPPAYWQSNTWPNCDYFFTGCGIGTLTARLFKDTPASIGLTTFADAYSGFTVMQVLSGSATPSALNATVRLGQETVAALLNAMTHGTNFPLPSADVITIFNSIATTGSYTTEFGEVWNEGDVYNYFHMLHI